MTLKSPFRGVVIRYLYYYYYSILFYYYILYYINSLETHQLLFNNLIFYVLCLCRYCQVTGAQGKIHIHFWSKISTVPFLKLSVPRCQTFTTTVGK